MVRRYCFRRFDVQLHRGCGRRTQKIHMFGVSSACQAGITCDYGRCFVPARHAAAWSVYKSVDKRGWDFCAIPRISACVFRLDVPFMNGRNGPGTQDVSKRGRKAIRDDTPIRSRTDGTCENRRTCAKSRQTQNRNRWKIKETQTKGPARHTPFRSRTAETHENRKT